MFALEADELQVVLIRAAELCPCLRFPGTACEGCSAERTLMKVREVLKLLRADGWTIARIRGSHRQMTRPFKSGTVTVAGKPGDDLGPKTLRSILRQAELEQ